MCLGKQGSQLFLKGIAMGAADLVPGISGGTIALITGIYEDLLHSLKSFNIHAIKLLGKRRFLACWKYINGNFLFCLGAGILTSIFCFASIIHYLMNTFPVPLWSFFFGLITISFVFLLKKSSRITFNYILALVIGTIIAWMITSATPVTIHSPSLAIFFLAGALAICAMILPGLSGSFILLLLGLYDPVLQAVMQLNWPIIVTFSGGCLCGLLCFSHLLNWLLIRFHTPVLGVLSGLMLGALNKVWPWKETLVLQESNEKIIQNNTSPWAYANNTSLTDLLLALACMLAGIILVIAIEKVFSTPRKGHSSD